jgi:hypothetical protein
LEEIGVNVWLFLLYGYFCFEFGGQAGKFHEREESGKGMIHIVLVALMTFIIWYFGGLQ